ncbi:MAG: YraN family protein [Candidatus Wildermuthbacteria bacterium]|nr:YraN family protein [Candidatus Wildermuthbacteria bacterium]
MGTKETGNWGERVAEDYLKNKGYEILDRNYSFRISGNPQKGEIDIVARKSDIISFIEVKTLSRGRASGFSPEEKVNFGKQRKLRISAESWLMRKRIPLNSKWQIDVVAIEAGNGKTEISHFENAVEYL